MATFDGHAAKRQRTDYQDSRDQFAGGNNYYGNNYNRNANTSGGGEGRPNVEEQKPNHILLITVMNPAYPITTDVIHTICAPSGKVLRIVVFKKKGVQAMVEFESIECANRAKESLNGCDIYSGCCTLKIDFAKPTRLNVYKNDSESFDYTNPSLGKPGGEPRPALLQEPPRGYGPPDVGHHGSRYGDGRGQMAGYDGGQDFNRGPRDPYNAPPGRDHYAGNPPPDRYGRDPYGRDVSGPPSGPPGYGPGGHMQAPHSGNHGVVMMVYGLCHEKMNCDRLFNLLCLYGNVIRVKYLKTKEGCAMIQMGDPLAVERSVSNLNGTQFFDSKLQLGYSKQAFLNDVQQPFQLPDGTPSFKDYMGNRNNRFTNPEAANKNRILAPSKVLHFFNAPFNITEDELKKIFEDAGAEPPIQVLHFTDKNKSERSSTGLLDFSSISKAIEGLVLCNHTPIPNPNGKFPFTLKLCFSSSGPRFTQQNN